LADRVSARLSPGEARRFGLLLSAIFAGIAVWPVVFQGGRWRGWAAALAGVLVILALAAPTALAPLHRLWMRLGYVLSWLNTRVLLGLTYFLVMMPIGMARRLLGRDPLDRRLRDRDSYWVVGDTPRDRRRSMERRF
jgi:hypothetical protein